MNKIALFLIFIYQKHLSPRKGYCCAYGALYNNGSCSERVALIIENHGILNGWSMIKNQFVLCSEAYETIKEKKKHKKKKEDNWCHPFDACDVLTCIPLPKRLCKGNQTEGDCDLPCDCSL